MNRTLILLGMLLGTSVVAQEYQPDAATEAEVNEHVWKKFKTSYEARDWETFNSLHTDDVLRVSKWGGIKVGEEYKERVRQSYRRTPKRKKVIDFWFEHRIYAEEVGYEVGYYRVADMESGAESPASYAQFHVVLRKVDGVWKIAQDWDQGTILGEKITAEDFAKGTPEVF